jgi:hypothetical protein
MMLRRARALAGALLLASGGGCGRGETMPTAAASATPLTLRMETAGFRLFADTVPDIVLRGIGDRLEAERPRVMADLGVASVRPMTARVWQDPAAWAAEVQRFFGRAIDTNGYVTGADELRVLSVSAVERNATHEMSHCVSLYVNPGFANRPRWLWETVALYENREFVDPRTLDYMVAGRPPTLPELDADVTASRRVYQVGYVLGEFIVSRAGSAGLVALIRANGDTSAVLGLSAGEFEAAWYAFVREKYLAAE